MVDIKDVKTTHCISSSEVKPTPELIEEWPTMSFDERSDWHTANVKRLKFDAREILEEAIEDLTWDGYEDMNKYCLDQIDDEHVEELQKVFDKISCHPVYDLYWESERIDPNSEVVR